MAKEGGCLGWRPSDCSPNPMGMKELLKRTRAQLRQLEEELKEETAKFDRIPYDELWSLGCYDRNLRREPMWAAWTAVNRKRMSLKFFMSNLTAEEEAENNEELRKELAAAPVLVEQQEEAAEEQPSQKYEQMQTTKAETSQKHNEAVELQRQKDRKKAAEEGQAAREETLASHRDNRVAGLFASLKQEGIMRPVESTLKMMVEEPHCAKAKVLPLPAPTNETSALERKTRSLWKRDVLAAGSEYELSSEEVEEPEKLVVSDAVLLGKRAVPTGDLFTIEHRECLGWVMDKKLSSYQQQMSYYDFEWILRMILTLGDQLQVAVSCRSFKVIHKMEEHLFDEDPGIPYLHNKVATVFFMIYETLRKNPGKKLDPNDIDTSKIIINEPQPMTSTGPRPRPSDKERKLMQEEYRKVFNNRQSRFKKLDDKRHSDRKTEQRRLAGLKKLNGITTEELKELELQQDQEQASEFLIRFHAWDGEPEDFEPLPMGPGWGAASARKLIAKEQSPASITREQRLARWEADRAEKRAAEAKAQADAERDAFLIEHHARKRRAQEPIDPELLRQAVEEQRARGKEVCANQEAKFRTNEDGDNYSDVIRGLASMSIDHQSGFEMDEAKSYSSEDQKAAGIKAPMFEMEEDKPDYLGDAALYPNSEDEEACMRAWEAPEGPGIGVERKYKPIMRATPELKKYQEEHPELSESSSDSVPRLNRNRRELSGNPDAEKRREWREKFEEEDPEGYDDWKRKERQRIQKLRKRTPSQEALHQEAKERKRLEKAEARRRKKIDYKKDLRANRRQRAEVLLQPP